MGEEAAQGGGAKAKQGAAMKSPYTRREKTHKARAELSPVAWMLRRVAARCGRVEASAGQWLLWLNRKAGDEAKASKDFPTTPNQLGRLFGELREGLALLGVEVTFCRSNGARVWRVESAKHAARRRYFAATLIERREDERARQREEKALFRSIRANSRRQNRKKG